MMKHRAAHKLLDILVFFYFIFNSFKSAFFNEIASEILGDSVIVAVFTVESESDSSFI